MHFQSLFLSSLAAMLTLSYAAPFGEERPNPLSQRLLTTPDTVPQDRSWPLGRLTAREIEVLVARTRSRSSSKSASSTSSTRSISSRHYKHCQEPATALRRRANDGPPPKIYHSVPLHSTRSNYPIGTYATVYDSTDPAHPNSVVKIITKERKEDISTELKALQKVGQLREWGVFEGTTYIVIKRVPGKHMPEHPLFISMKKQAKESVQGKKNLEDLFSHVRKLLEVEVKRVMKTFQVMHTDLHVNNVLVEGTTKDQLKVHLIDWGLVRFIGQDCHVEEAEIDATLADKIHSADFYPSAD